jgi:hypothetical protein
MTEGTNIILPEVLAAKRRQREEQRLARQAFAGSILEGVRDDDGDRPRAPASTPEYRKPTR